MDPVARLLGIEALPNIDTALSDTRRKLQFII